MTITYALRRSEIWRYYAWMWRRKLWKFHVVIVPMLAVAAAMVLRPTTPVAWFLAAGVSVVPVLLLMLYPQLKFKPQLRTLSLSANGIATWIGKKSANYEWRKFEGVFDLGDCIMLALNNNCAFIVPNRAFSDAQQRTEFFRAAQDALSVASK